MSDELIIVVSKLGEREQLFFSRWDLKDAEESPYVRYISEDGRECGPTVSIMALIRGDFADLPDRVVLAVRASQAPMKESFLLIHTGDAQQLKKAIAGKSPSDEFSTDWEILGHRSFSLRSDQEPYLIIRNELASYGAKGDLKFREALAFLREALSKALALHPGDTSNAEARSIAARECLDGQSNRISAGLPATKPRPRLNPVSALIHDVVSRFDALLIDLQTSLEDAEYWKEERERYKGSLKDYLERLGALLTVSETGRTDLESVAQIASRIIESGRITDAEEAEVRETTADLREMAPNRAWQSAFDLLNAINEGKQDKIVRSDFEKLHLWLNTLRQKLAILDDLFKKSRPPSINT
jgi:hypothetical protein